MKLARGQGEMGVTSHGKSDKLRQRSPKNQVACEGTGGVRQSHTP